MKKCRILCFLLCALLLLPAGCGKARGGAPIDKPLFEMFADERSQAFIAGFDENDVNYVRYDRDQHNTVDTEDKALIREVFEGLRDITVTKKYTGGMSASDAGSSVSFVMNDGTGWSVGFDFGNVSIAGALYEFTGAGRLNDAIARVRDEAEGRYLFDLYATDDFDGSDVEALTYRFPGGEISCTDAAGDIFALLAGTEVLGKDRDRDPADAPAEALEFSFSGGSVCSVLFDFDSTFDVYADGEWYRCAYAHELHDLLADLRA